MIALSHQKPKVYIIVIACSVSHVLQDCLTSSLCQDYPNFNVLLIMNGVSQCDFIEQFPKKVLLFFLEKRCGYAEACNLGIHKALADNADFVWLLNDDIFFSSDTLSSLVNKAVTATSVGLVTPLIVDSRDSTIIQHQGCVIDKSKFSLVRDNTPETGKAMTVLWGTALLVSRRLIESIGYFDVSYFMYYEDFDYSLRSLGAGFRNIVDYGSCVYHYSALSSGGNTSTGYLYYMTRNELLFWRRIGSPIRLWVFLSCYLWKCLVTSVSLQARGLESSSSACIAGATSAILGKTGRAELITADNKFIKMIVRILAVGYRIVKRT